MSRVNVYLPDELAAQAKDAELNISNLTQEAIRSALAVRNLTVWQSRMSELTSPAVDHKSVSSAVDAAKDELEGG